MSAEKSLTETSELKPGTLVWLDFHTPAIVMGEATQCKLGDFHVVGKWWTSHMRDSECVALAVRKKGHFDLEEEWIPQYRPTYQVMDYGDLRKEYNRRVDQAKRDAEIAIERDWLKMHSYTKMRDLWKL